VLHYGQNPFVIARLYVPVGGAKPVCVLTEQALRAAGLGGPGARPDPPRPVRTASLLAQKQPILHVRPPPPVRPGPAP
jgi:hypothetical protein